MLKAYAHLFCLIGDTLGTFGSAVEMIKNPDVPYAPEKKEGLLRSLEQTHIVCSEVKLPVSVLGIEWAQKQVEAEGVTVRRVGEVFRELTRRIQDELSSLRFLYVPPDRALYYQQRIKADDTKTKHSLLRIRPRKSSFSRSRTQKKRLIA